MGDRPKSVIYKWTARDQLIARGDLKAGKYVTPYRMLPQSVERAREHEAGAMVPVVLSRSGEPWAVNRFFPGDKDFVWDAIPDEVTGCSTIADLCAKLLANNPHKYVANYYDLSKKSESAKNEAALLLFDHWENTEYRYAVVSGEGFSWSSLAQGAAAMPAEKGGKKLRFALIKRPVVIPVSAAPGSQVVRPADPGLELITADIYAIASRAKRIKQLFAESEEIMKRRVLFAADISALKALFQASATSTSGMTLEASALAAKTAALEPLIKEAMLKKPIAELLPKDKGGLLSDQLEKAVREQLGYVDDIGAEVKKLADELRDLLLKDREFADRCATWGRYVFSNNLQSTPAFASKCGRLVAAVTAALEMLGETEHSDEVLERLWAIIDARPTHGASRVDDIRPEMDSALATLFSIIGNGSKASLTFIGNLAGPPSLSIAAIQAAAAWSLIPAAKAAANSDMSGFARMATRIFNALAPMLSPRSELATKLNAARAAMDEDALFRLRDDFAEAMGAKFQISPGWKSSVVLLQLLGLAFTAMNAGESRDGVNRGLTLHDYLDVGIQTTSTAAGAFEVFLMLRKIDKLNDFVKELGLAVGRLSAAVGIILALMDIDVSKRDSFDRFVALTSLIGNMFLLIGSFAALGVPGLQQIGLILLAANIVLSLYKQTQDSDRAAAPLGTNLVASGIVQSIWSSPFYKLLVEDPAIGPKLREVTGACRKANLPYGQNTALVIDMLRHAGLTKKERAMIVNTDAPPAVVSLDALLAVGL